VSRSEENGCIAFGAPTKIPLQVSGNTSCPGWWPILSEAVATFSPELQLRSPGRYQPLQIRTLQRGMRKIRAYLLQTREEQWQEEVIRGHTPIGSAERATRSS
jgi:hypothetical protein